MDEIDRATHLDGFGRLFCRCCTVIVDPADQEIAKLYFFLIYQRQRQRFRTENKSWAKMLF